MNILSICTGMGLLDRAFLDAGHTVVPACEIDLQKRAMYLALCGELPRLHDLAQVADHYRGQYFDLIIGGPSCQKHSKLRAIRKPKFPDLTPLVLDILEAVPHGGYLFENVVPIAIPGAVHTMCNAMHYYQPPPIEGALVHPLAAHRAARACLHGQRRLAHGVPRRRRTHLWPEARRQAAGLSGRGAPALPVRPAAARPGGCSAVPAGAGLGQCRGARG